MYKIIMTAIDENAPDFHKDNIYKEVVCDEDGYTRKEDAFMEMVKCAMNELNALNGIDCIEFSDDRIYVIFMNEDGHDIVIKVIYEGEEKRYDVTYYDVVRTSKQKETEEINKRLWEEQGEDLTIEIFYDEDDESYYWESSTSGAEDSGFETPEDALESIEDYLFDLELAYS